MGIYCSGGVPQGLLLLLYSQVFSVLLRDLSYQFLLFSRMKLCFHPGTAREHKRAAGAT